MNSREVVNGALRKIGVLAAGREPRAADLNDGFDALTALYRQLITNGAFGVLRDVIPVSDYVAFENERIFRNTTAVVSVTLPETVRNWTFWADYSIYGIYPNEPVPPATNAINQDVRTPRDCAVVTIINSLDGLVMDFIYDGQKKAWQGLYDLTLDSEAPLSFRDPLGLQALLAAQIAEEYGKQLGPITIRQSSNFQYALTTRPSFCDEPVYVEMF